MPIAFPPSSPRRATWLVASIVFFSLAVAAGPMFAAWQPVATPDLDLADGVDVAADPLGSDVAYALVGQRKVVRSDDQGRTWTTLGFAPQSAPFVFTPDEVDRFLTVDRRTGARERVLVGAYDGLWASDDGGGFLPAGPLRQRPRAVALPDAAPDRWIVGYDDGSLYRTDDDGVSWRLLTRPAPGGFAVGALATDALDPERLWLLLDRPIDSACPGGNCSAGLLASSDFGTTWSLLLEGAAGDVLHVTSGTVTEIVTQVDAFTLAWSGDGGASFETAAPGARLDAAAFDDSSGLAWIADEGGTVVRSDDGGRTWAQVAELDLPVVGLAWVGAGPRPGRLLAAIGGISADGPGVLRSDDLGLSFEAIETIDAGNWSTIEPILGSDARVDGALATAGARVVRFTDGGQTTEVVFDGENGIFLDLDRSLSDPSVLYATGIVGGAAVWRSDDGGDSWTPSTTLEPSIAARVAVASSSPDLVLVTAGGFTGTGSVYRTADGGATWDRVLDADAFDVAFDPSDASVAYVNGFDGVLRSLDGGVTWQPLSLSLDAVTLDVDPSGTLWIVTADPENGLIHSSDRGETFDSAGRLPLPPTSIPLVLDASRAAEGIVVLGTSDDGVLYSTDGCATWQRLSEGLPAAPVADVAIGDDGVLWAASFGAGVFRGRFDDPPLATTEGRFLATVSWRDFEGTTGVGHATLRTDDTGTFWFFGEDNLELMVKVLDGRSVNEHWWVYYGALSNVELTLTVTDSVTGRVVEYFNPLGTFASQGDVTAFFEPLPVVVDAGVGPFESGPPKSAPIVSPVVETPDPLPYLALSERFRVTVQWRDFEGVTGLGVPVPLTPDTGSFWFFGRENLEMMVKVVDGRAVNGKFWVFFGSLTNVELTMTVTDTETGEVVEYFNPLGTFASVGDVDAFDG